MSVNLATLPGFSLAVVLACTDMFRRNVQKSATRMLRRDGQKDQEFDVKKDANLLAPDIRVQESAKNPSRHGLNDIARVVLQTQKRKNKTSTESHTEQGILQRAECERHMNPTNLCNTEAC